MFFFLDKKCILCPNTSCTYEIMTTHDGKSVHRVCAEAIPETFIENDTIYGIKDIPAARRKLVNIYQTKERKKKKNTEKKKNKLLVIKRYVCSVAKRVVHVCNAAMVNAGSPSM